MVGGGAEERGSEDASCPGISLILLVQKEDFLKMSQALGVEKVESCILEFQEKIAQTDSVWAQECSLGREERDEKQTEHDAARWDTQTRHGVVGTGSRTDNQTLGASQGRRREAWGTSMTPVCIWTTSAGDPFLFHLWTPPRGP